MHVARLCQKDNKNIHVYTHTMFTTNCTGATMAMHPIYLHIFRNQQPNVIIKLRIHNSTFDILCVYGTQVLCWKTPHMWITSMPGLEQRQYHKRHITATWFLTNENMLNFPHIIKHCISKWTAHYITSLKCWPTSMQCMPHPYTMITHLGCNRLLIYILWSVWLQVLFDMICLGQVGIIGGFSNMVHDHLAHNIPLKVFARTVIASCDNAFVFALGCPRAEIHISLRHLARNMHHIVWFVLYTIWVQSTKQWHMLCLNIGQYMRKWQCVVSH